MRILDNNLTLSSTLSATGTNTSYPLANLKSPFLEELWKGIDTDETITINFGSNKTIDCVYLGYTNATAITVKLYDSNDSLLSTITVSPVFFGEVFSTIVGVRYATIRLQSSEIVYCGNIGIGNSYTITNPAMGVSPKIIDNSVIVTNSKGQTLKNKIPVLREYETTHENMDVNVFNEVIAIVSDNIQPIWVDIYEQAHAKIPPMYASISMNNDTSQSWQRYTCKLTFTEAK